jgi:catechol 2,3-dioxygenase-like lactoylglutathione lyase family enzyme
MQLERTVEDLRAFLPAKDFATSREFYGALGFEQVWRSEKLALFKLGRLSFFLQDYFVKEWAENMMLDLRVGDVQAYWSYLQGLELSQRFPGVRLGAPQDDPASGIRRGNLCDPSGVLWHFSQSIG